MEENPYEPPTGAESRPFSLSPPFVLVMLIFGGMGLGYVVVLYRHPRLIEFHASGVEGFFNPINQLDRYLRPKTWEAVNPPFSLVEDVDALELVEPLDP